MASPILHSLLFLFSVCHVVLAWNSSSTSARSIDWTDCTADYNSSVQLFCADYYVPLDYSDPNSTATINVPLQKFPASKTPSKGTVLYNCGGPGIDCRVLDYDGQRLQLFTGGEYDIVAFAPRGSADPNLFSCFTDQSARDRVNYGAGIPGNSSDTALGQIWAYSLALDDACLATQKDFGSLIGSTFVAKDMLSLTEALNEDGLFRYYGISAGTVLGMTFLALYPDKVEKVILDGNQNVNQYYHEYEQQAITDTDAVFATFCTACVENTTACPLGKNFSSGADLLSAIESAVWDLKFNPVPVVLPNDGYYIFDYTTVKNAIFGDLYFPTTWYAFVPLLTFLLTHDLIEANVTDPTQLGLALGSATTNEAAVAIQCSDKIIRTPTLHDFIPVVEARHKVSPFTSDISDGNPAQCAQWPFEAKERYTGNFQLKTRKPVLFVGNTFDPVTPLVSAKNMSSGVEGSAVLQHNGTGHTAIYTQASRCTAKAMQRYFANWTLPEPGTICPIDIPFFLEITGWDDVVAEFDGDNNTSFKF